MKKLTALLVGAVLMVGMAVSLAGATPFIVSGSDTPGAYSVTKDLTDGTKVPVAVIAPTSVWVSGAWMTFDNTDQAWPMNPTTSGSLPGTYSYTTSFDLTGLDPSTAIIKGSWASDNGGELYINNLDLGVNNGFNSLKYFTISSGFISGINVLTFEVTNESYGDFPGINPTGLLVNITEATANPVPEPGTMALLGFGMLGLAVYGKRRMNKEA